MTGTSIRPSHLAGAVVALVAAGLLIFRAPWSAGAASSDLSRGSNVMMNCEPGQQALVRQSTVNGEPQVLVNCVSTPAAAQASYASGQAQYTQASYVRPVSTAPRVARASTVTRTTTAAQERSGSTRSWKTTALVIGGSTGAGAGIGGAVGGKKGALIGAAIGGGSAAIFEAIKR
jgi:hypothetical protein